jgi:ferrous iron transport protein A
MSDRKPPASAARPSAYPTLDQIPKGEIVRVQSVAGDDGTARRLGELGVRKGVEIEVLQRAPLGDPTLFELCGYQLCLRRSESARIRVERVIGVTSEAGSPDLQGRNT